MSKCRRCGKLLPPGHGFCSLCACYADGYDSGAHHCDDFEGTTDADAVKFAWENLTELAFEHSGMFAHHFLNGAIDGLKSHAARNAETAKRLEEEERADV